MLVDRFLEGAVEIDVDALCDGEDTWVAALMEHVEEAGVHSGDSSCALPPVGLPEEVLAECIDVVRGLAPALGVVGLINVQLALHEGRLFVLEANPRASRTIPFASKALGVNLVEAACKLVAGAPLSALDASRGQTPGHVSVKASVFPFARFPGADAVLGPEMRSTGEVMATAADFPTAFAKAERAAGRPLPTGGTAFLSVRDEDKPAAVELGRGLAALGFALCATGGTAWALAAAGLKVDGIRKVTEPGDGLDRRRPHPAPARRARRQHAGRARRALRRLPHPRGRAPRPRALRDDDRGRRGGGRGHRARDPRRDPLPPGTCRPPGLASSASRPVGPYALVRLRRGERRARASRASSSCSAPARPCCRGR